MENACALIAAVGKVWTAPSALEKALPLVLRDVTLQGHRWRYTLDAPCSFLSLHSSFAACEVIVRTNLVLEYHWILCSCSRSA